MKYTQEHIDFLSQNIKGLSFKELTEKFNEHFKISLTLEQIMSACKNRKMRNGRDLSFTPGHKPHNAGTKGLMKANAGTFKKGHRPKNHKPVGSERITVDGYIEIKVAEPKKWKMKHVIEWERAYGKIPAGNILIFGDRDKTNTYVENLILVNRSELLYLNQNGMIFEDADLTKTAANIAKIRTIIYEKENKRREKYDK